MPSTSEKQEKFMQAAAHNPEFAERVEISQTVAKEFVGEDSAMGKAAAGIAYITSDNRFLLIKRGQGGDEPATWAFPGGHIENGESDIEAAIREFKEEVGYEIDNDSISNSCQKINNFTTFIARGQTFIPTLSNESDGYAWVSSLDLPQPLHPGMVQVLNSGQFKHAIGSYHTELDYARAIRDGELSSPQKFANVWLFDMRITGTGTAYRSKLDEMVYRPPEIYMNDEFLARCNGLQVILEHPEKGTLNSEEFKKRNAGSIFLPYLKEEEKEVWGIAKIYDDLAVSLMLENKLSTSPTVVFQKIDNNSTIMLQDGTNVLIEGCPSLLDHVAICGVGVWDKGGEPVGVTSDSVENINLGDSKMEKEKVEEVKKDDDMASRFDAMVSRFDAMMSKVDELAKAKEEPKEVVADKKADAEEEKKEEDVKKSDAADEIKKRIDAVEQMLPKVMSDDDYAAMADCQSRADSLASAFGESASRPQQGETVLSYRKRLAAKFKKFSPTYKDIELSKIADDSLFGIVENQIYNDAYQAANNPALGVGETLREIKTRSPAGHQISTFKGDIDSWMSNFKADAFKVVGLHSGNRN